MIALIAAEVFRASHRTGWRGPSQRGAGEVHPPHQGVERPVYHASEAGHVARAPAPAVCGVPASAFHPHDRTWRNLPGDLAHNTTLDRFTQREPMAVLSLLRLAATTPFNNYKALLAGLFRNPIFWFSIALCLVDGLGTRRAAKARNWC
jgi:hypothetical protein